jgi:hypothetical protein
MIALTSSALKTCACVLGTYKPSCTDRPARLFFILEAHGPQGSRRTRGALEPSQRVRSHDTRGGAGALLIREVGSGAAGHMVASESTSAEGQGPVLQGTWRRVGARHAPYLDLKLVRWGTRSAGTDTFH